MAKNNTAASPYDLSALSRERLVLSKRQKLVERESPYTLTLETSLFAAKLLSDEK